jgi:hypothetical protein
MERALDPAAALTGDERAAARAFVQRCEVRLSTLHRIALAVLSGAGLLVVLPVVARDSISGIIRSLLIGDLQAMDGFLVVAIGAVLVAPGMAMWLLFRDLTRFYFYANHFGDTRSETFTPRFTLTSLRLPSDELDGASAADLDRARHDPPMVELLVPANDASRARIDRQIGIYGLGLGPDNDDQVRADALLELAASASRPLVDEVAKIEYGMARHVLRLQGIVLRYVKTLLALLTSAIAIYAGDAVVAGTGLADGIDATQGIWLAAVVLVWVPALVFAVTSPVRWVEQTMRTDGATSSAIENDPELTFVERVLVRIAGVGYVAATGGMIAALVDGSVTTAGVVAGVCVLVVSAAAVVGSIASGRVRSLMTLH